LENGAPLGFPKGELSPKIGLQGKYGPHVDSTQKRLQQSVRVTSRSMREARHIFNLGHGILPDVPVENAIHFVSECKRVS